MITQHAHAGRRTITVQMHHSKSTNRQVGQRVPWASPVMKIPDPSMQGHCEASAKALNLRRLHPHSVQLMIFSREIQKLSVLLFFSPHMEGNVSEDKDKLHEHYRGKNAPKCDVKHMHLTTGSLYEQAQGEKYIQVQGTL